MADIDRIDDSQGPITMGEYPADVYQEFERRDQILSTSPSWMQDSSIIAAATQQDQLDIVHDHIALANGDMYRNHIFSEIGKPPQFSTQTLFQSQSIMQSFGPQTKQTEDLEKIARIESNTPDTHKEAAILKEYLETTSHLNGILLDTHNQSLRIAKG